MIHEELYWEDALAECLTMSDPDYTSDLVSINSAREMEFIKSK